VEGVEQVVEDKGPEAACCGCHTDLFFCAGRHGSSYVRSFDDLMGMVPVLIGCCNNPAHFGTALCLSKLSTTRVVVVRKAEGKPSGNCKAT
jgi:hypothetical protein